MLQLFAVRQHELVVPQAYGPFSGMQRNPLQHGPLQCMQGLRQPDSAQRKRSNASVS